MNVLNWNTQGYGNWRGVLKECEKIESKYSNNSRVQMRDF